ncbi:hypothetical protein [Thalassobius sp. Cn5-15]|uniref:hypothetical protein n=1 Tax=Thalassobius sp. Cn5-15 TaxID=2917763 RepID=UPI001EF32A15|nr:hypothetical protein [Thalassobius sp. Cn5-15]MCG7494732.1 hypothetical protein [Thalassobius sp. Cn5-15]
MKQLALMIFPAVFLTACDQVPSVSNLTDRPWLREGSLSTPQTTERLPETPDVEVASLPDEETASPPVSSAAGQLGLTVASLGDATREGFWIETPLVSSPQRGKVRYPKTGREVKVDLIPRSGASSGGSSLSLGAMRLLDVPLTALAEVEVYVE